MKLTKTQITALAALPARITMWGGKPFSGMPKGIWSRSTLAALSSRGLAHVSYHGSTEEWRLTEAGRAALKEMGE